MLQSVPSAVVLSFFFVSFLVVVFAVEVEVDPEDAALSSAPGKCQLYHRGSTSGLHYYGCCNNCHNTTSAPCDGTTYQSASNSALCGKCGTNVGNPRNKGQRIATPFSCGGCVGQQVCERRCSGWTKQIPGMCWRFTGCWRRCCRDSIKLGVSEWLRLASLDSVCGDGVCSKDESQWTCPMDCCGKANALCDSFNNTRCVSSCCGEEECCLDRPGLIIGGFVGTLGKAPCFGAWGNVAGCTCTKGVAKQSGFFSGSSSYQCIWGCPLS